MAVTLTYDPTLARVRITADGLAAADVATVERSTDQVRWTTVRGGSACSVTAGALTLPLDDYEFAPGVVNYYRVRGVETGNIGMLAAGAAATGNNTSVMPALPAGLVAGDTMLLFASIRSVGVGSVGAVAGWTNLAAFTAAGVRVFARTYQPGDTAPTVTFTGGAAGDDTGAQIVAMRRMSPTPIGPAATQTNAAAQNIAYPAWGVVPTGGMAVLVAWKQDDWSSVAGVPGMFPGEIGEIIMTAGNDAGMVWSAMRVDVGAAPGTVPAGSLVVTGGAAAVSRASILVFAHADYLNEQIASTTPAQAGTWLKSIQQPFLNTQVTPRPVTPQSRSPRGGVFDAVGESTPVATTDYTSSKRFDLALRTRGVVETGNLEYLVSAGDIMLLQPPAGSRIPAGYVKLVGDARAQPLGASETVHWTLPMQIVDAPDADVIGATATCDTILAHFATCNDVLAAFPTCNDLMNYVADPSDVIVP